MQPNNFHWINVQSTEETFDELDLTNYVFDHCYFERCTFRGTVLKEIRSESTVFSQCDFVRTLGAKVDE